MVTEQTPKLKSQFPKTNFKSQCHKQLKCFSCLFSLTIMGLQRSLGFWLFFKCPVWLSSHIPKYYTFFHSFFFFWQRGRNQLKLTFMFTHNSFHRSGHMTLLIGDHRVWCKHIHRRGAGIISWSAVTNTKEVYPVWDSNILELFSSFFLGSFCSFQFK